MGAKREVLYQKLQLVDKPTETNIGIFRLYVNILDKYF